jgi:hypothetical protein
MGRVSREARLLFVLLWTIVDDHGKARASSRVLASVLYPFDDDAKDTVDMWLAELETQRCVVLYEVDGVRYLQVTKWREHQKIDRPSKSRLPEPPENPREPSRALATPSRTDLGPRTLDLGPRTKDQEEDSAPSGASTTAEEVKLDRPTVYAFEDGIIRLNEKDFELWKRSFSALDVPAELIALSNWAQTTFGPKKWFHGVKNALAKKNREELARRAAASQQHVFKTFSGMDGIV